MKNAVPAVFSVVQVLLLCAVVTASDSVCAQGEAETPVIPTKSETSTGPTAPAAAKAQPVRNPPKSANLKRAEKLYFSKKYETAAALLRKIVEEEPENGRANSLLGDVYYLQGFHEKALSHLMRASELNENKAPDLFRLGQAYEKLNKPKEAVRSYLKAYEQDETMKEALFHVGFVYLSLERNKKKTIEYWQKFVDEATTDPQREKVATVLKFLRDPNFVLPDKNSPISLEEALMLGGATGPAEPTTGDDKGAGHEKAKEKNDGKELLDDDSLN